MKELMLETRYDFSLPRFSHVPRREWRGVGICRQRFEILKCKTTDVDFALESLRFVNVGNAKVKEWR
jgi:hypothetical protein